MKLHPKELLQIGHVEIRNASLLKGRKIIGVSTDSRTVQKGDLFVALNGSQFDGHKFLADACDKGASVAIVARSSHIAEVSMPLLVVEDTVLALGELAKLYRAKFDLPILAVGGSNGKTTTKDMIANVLNMEYNVLKTEGNHNNHIGVPQTIFRLQKKHEIAVVEIGTNHPGEIEYLCSLLQPTHGLITNIGREHLEFFKTVQGVADEEAKLFQSLRNRKKAHVFVNTDDPELRARAKGIKRKTDYGFNTRQATVKGRIVDVDESGCALLEFRGGKGKKRTEVRLGVPGEHNAMNALAAAAVGLVFRVPAKRIRKSLESFKPSTKRMEVQNLGGVIIYNDTYNANPDSMLFALRTLAAAKIPGKKIAVLGDMRELGAASTEEHNKVGAEIPKLGIDYLLTYGVESEHIHNAADLPLSVHYDQKNILAEYLAELIAPGDAVLIKGSRGMKMEDVVTFLEERLRSAVVPFG